MKNYIFLLLICVGIFLTSCSNKNNTIINGCKFDSIVIDTVAYLNNNTSPSCTIHLNIKTAIDKNSQKINASILSSGILLPDYLSLTNKKLSPKEAINMFVETYIADYKEFYTTLNNIYPKDGYANIMYNVHTNVNSYRDNVVNYLAIIKQIAGNSSTTMSISKNIDITTGHILTLKDIFVPGYENELNENITEEFYSLTNTSTTNQLSNKGYFMGGKIYAPENFILKDNEITFIYVVGEVADREKGEIKITLKLSNLDRILK